MAGDEADEDLVRQVLTATGVTTGELSGAAVGKLIASVAGGRALSSQTVSQWQKGRTGLSAETRAQLRRFLRMLRPPTGEEEIRAKRYAAELLRRYAEELEREATRDATSGGAVPAADAVANRPRGEGEERPAQDQKATDAAD